MLHRGRTARHRARRVGHHFILPHKPCPSHRPSSSVAVGMASNASCGVVRPHPHTSASASLHSHTLDDRHAIRRLVAAAALRRAHVGCGTRRAIHTHSAAACIAQAHRMESLPRRDVEGPLVQQPLARRDSAHRFASRPLWRVYNMETCRGGLRTWPYHLPCRSVSMEPARSLPIRAVTSLRGVRAVCDLVAGRPLVVRPHVVGTVRCGAPARDAEHAGHQMMSAANDCTASRGCRGFGGLTSRCSIVRRLTHSLPEGLKPRAPSRRSMCTARSTDGSNGILRACRRPFRRLRPHHHAPRQLPLFALLRQQRARIPTSAITSSLRSAGSRANCLTRPARATILTFGCARAWERCCRHSRQLHCHRPLPPRPPPPPPPKRLASVSINRAGRLEMVRLAAPILDLACPPLHCCEPDAQGRAFTCRPKINGAFAMCKPLRRGWYLHARF